MSRLSHALAYGLVGILTSSSPSVLAAMFTPRHGRQISTVFDKYFAQNCLMIRPSGNPLDLDGFKGMLGSPDIIVEKDEVISVDDVKLFAGGEAAIVVYTTLSKFTYQGNPNDDVAKFSATLEKANGAGKIVHLHRGTGQKPS